MKISHENIVKVEIELDSDDLVTLSKDTKLASTLILHDIPQEYGGAEIKLEIFLKLKDGGV